MQTYIGQHWAIILLYLTHTTCVQSCAQGEFLNGASICDKCPLGKFQVLNNHQLTDCQACPRGTFGQQTGAVTCSICPAATYTDSVGQTMCRSCRPDSYRSKPGATSAADCLSCSEAKRWSITIDREQGTDDIDQCVCPMGRVDFLSANATSVGVAEIDRCALCPDGAACDKTGTVLTTVNSKRGYWRSSSTSSKFYRCLSKYDDCVGGGSKLNESEFNSIHNSTALQSGAGASGVSNMTSSNGSSLSWATTQQCREGNHGVLCATCLPGHVRDNNGQCINCYGTNKGAWNTILLLFGCFCIIFFTASLAMTCPSNGQEQHKLKKMRRVRSLLYYLFFFLVLLLLLLLLLLVHLLVHLLQVLKPLTTTLLSTSLHVPIIHATASFLFHFFITSFLFQD